MIYEPCKAWYVKWRFVMRKFTAVYIAVVAVVYTIVNLQAALMQNWMPAYLHLWPYLLFCTYVLASAVLAFGGFLLNLYPRVMGFQVFEPIVWVIKALARKLGRPIRPHRDDEEHEQNSMLGLLLSAPVIGVVFFIVLMAVLPTLVLWEEKMCSGKAFILSGTQSGVA